MLEQTTRGIVMDCELNKYVYDCEECGFCEGERKMENNKNTNTGIGFVGLLTIAFIVLKLIGIISWSWLWVLSPIWISVILGIILFVIILWLFK